MLAVNYNGQIQQRQVKLLHVQFFKFSFPGGRGIINLLDAVQSSYFHYEVFNYRYLRQAPAFVNLNCSALLDGQLLNLVEMCLINQVYTPPSSLVIYPNKIASQDLLHFFLGFCTRFLQACYVLYILMVCFILYLSFGKSGLKFIYQNLVANVEY